MLFSMVFLVFGSLPHLARLHVTSPLNPQELANLAWSWDVTGETERLRVFLQAPGGAACGTDGDTGGETAVDVPRDPRVPGAGKHQVEHSVSIGACFARFSEKTPEATRHPSLGTIRKLTAGVCE